MTKGYVGVELDEREKEMKGKKAWLFDLETGLCGFGLGF